MVKRAIAEASYRDPAGLPATLTDGDTGIARVNPDRVAQICWPEEDSRVMFSHVALAAIGQIDIFAAPPAGERIGLLELQVTVLAGTPTLFIENWTGAVAGPRSFTVELTTNSKLSYQWWPPWMGEADNSWRARLAVADSVLIQARGIQF